MLFGTSAQQLRRDITESRGLDELKKAAYLGLILVIRRPPSPPEHATMSEVTSSTIELPVSSSRDVLTEILRESAQRMLSTAIEAEVAEWITSHAHLVDAQGRRQVVRNGRLPKRSITTGVGQVEEFLHHFVKMPTVAVHCLCESIPVVGGCSEPLKFARFRPTKHYGEVNCATIRSVSP